MCRVGAAACHTTDDAGSCRVTPRPWDGLVPATDAAAYAGSGYGRTTLDESGRPALVIIDMNRNFLGDGPTPLDEAQQHFPYSCGPAGWEALPRIRALLRRFREGGLPVYFTTGRWQPEELGQMARKNSRATELLSNPVNSRIVPELAPAPGEVVIEKRRPSSFFGTPLAAYLISRRVDTVVLAGNTTSGCVRATAVDSYSFGFATLIPQSCVFDRVEVSHRLSLFDLHNKYASVLSDDELDRYLTAVEQVPRTPDTPRQPDRAAAESR